MRENANAQECREYQLDGLLNWKTLDNSNDLDYLINGKECSAAIQLPSILDNDLESYGEDLEALLLNPPWGQDYSFKDFTKLRLPLGLMKEGLIFIWVEKELIADIIDYFEGQGIKYVENVVWVKLDTSKQNCNQLFF